MRYFLDWKFKNKKERKKREGGRKKGRKEEKEGGSKDGRGKRREKRILYKVVDQGPTQKGKN